MRVTSAASCHGRGCDLTVSYDTDYAGEHGTIANHSKVMLLGELYQSGWVLRRRWRWSGPEVWFCPKHAYRRWS